MFVLREGNDVYFQSLEGLLVDPVTRPYMIFNIFYISLVSAYSDIHIIMMYCAVTLYILFTYIHIYI